MYYLNLKTLKATVNIICASYQHSALNSHFIACSAKMYLGRLSRFPVPVVKMLSSDSGGSGEALQGEGEGSRASLKSPQHWGFSSTRLAGQGPSRCSAALVHGGRQRAACPSNHSPQWFCSTSKGTEPMNSCPNHPRGHISSLLYQCVHTMTSMSSTEPQSCPGSQL